MVVLACSGPPERSTQLRLGLPDGDRPHTPDDGISHHRGYAHPGTADRGIGGDIKSAAANLPEQSTP